MKGLDQKLLGMIAAILIVLVLLGVFTYIALSGSDPFKKDFLTANLPIDILKKIFGGG